MKYIFLFLFFFAMLNAEIVGEYNIVDNSKGDKLIIKVDNNFIYQKRGSSCWLWQDIEGRCEVKNDTLTLFENRTFYELDKNKKNVVKEWKKIV
ncbi:MAG: hypothetical protein AB8B78_03875 [Polaribacter sp.]